MRTSLIYRLFAYLFFWFYISISNAQWVEISNPEGPFLADGFEVLNDKIFTARYTQSKVSCAYTDDLLNWHLAVELPMDLPYGRTKVLSKNNQLYLFAWNWEAQTADAWKSNDIGLNWEAKPLPFPRPYLFETGTNNLLCASENTISISQNDGTSWETTLTSPGKIFDLRRVGDQTLLATTRDYIYRSTDDGQSWESLAAPYDTDGIDNPNLFLFPTAHGVFIEFRQLEFSDLLRSQDLGDSWNVLTVPSTTGKYNYVRDLKSKGNTLWGVFNGGGGLVASSQDAGETWEFELTPQGTYCLGTIGDTLFAGTSDGFFKTFNDAHSWFSGNQGWEPMSIDVNNNFSFGYIYANEEKLFLSTSDRDLYWTNNDGIIWELVANVGHFDYHFTFGDTLLFFGKGAVRSFDGGENWEILPNDTLYKPYNSNHIFAEIDRIIFAQRPGQDFLLRSTDLGSTWEEIPTSFPFIRQIASSDGVLYLRSSLGIYQSTNFGQTFSPFNTGLSTFQNVEGIWGTANHVFAYTDDKVWRRDGNQWILAGAGLVDNGQQFPILEDVISKGGQTLLYGHENFVGQPAIYLSGDGGLSWTGNWAEPLPHVYHPSLSVVLHNETMYAMGLAAVFLERNIIWKWEGALVNSTEVLRESTSFSLFPNPTNQNFWISLTEDNEIPEKVMISTIAGKEVWSSKWSNGHQFVVPVNDFSPGVYSVSLLWNNGQKTSERLIVVH